MADLMTIWTIATTIFVFLWSALKVIAPYTKTDKDDKIVKIMEQLIKLFSIQTKNQKLEISIKKK